MKDTSPSCRSMLLASVLLPQGDRRQEKREGGREEAQMSQSKPPTQSEAITDASRHH